MQSWGFSEPASAEIFLTQKKIPQKRDSVWQAMLFKHITHLKPERGGGNSGNPREFDCDVYPQGGGFDRTSIIWPFNSNSRRGVNHLFLTILTTIFCPGVGILIIFFLESKMSKSPPYALPPPLGLDFDRCITDFCFLQSIAMWPCFCWQSFHTFELFNI